MDLKATQVTDTLPYMEVLQAIEAISSYESPDHGTYTNRGHYQFIEVIRDTEDFHAIGPISTLQRGDTKVIKTPHIIEYVIMDISAIETTCHVFMQIIKTVQFIEAFSGTYVYSGHKDNVSHRDITNPRSHSDL